MACATSITPEVIEDGEDQFISNRIQVAIILKQMVPNQMFSASMALVCAGYE